MRVGGLAFSNGVMIRGPNYICSTALKSDGKIVKRKRFKPLLDRKFNVPILRGAINFFEFLIQSSKETLWSLSQEDDEEYNAFDLFLMVFLTLVIVFVIFKAIPWAVASFIPNVFYANIVDLIVKIVLFIGYLFLLRNLSATKNMFKYHGAEHKVLNAYKNNKKLTLTNARKESLIYPFCSTTFFFLVLVISFFFYLLIPQDLSYTYNILIRVLLLPLIAGVTYEFLRSGFNFSPALSVQRLTLSEPDDKHLKIALISLKDCIKAES